MFKEPSARLVQMFNLKAMRINSRPHGIKRYLFSNAVKTDELGLTGRVFTVPQVKVREDLTPLPQPRSRVKRKQDNSFLYGVRQAVGE